MLDAKKAFWPIFLMFGLCFGYMMACDHLPQGLLRAVLHGVLGGTFYGFFMARFCPPVMNRLHQKLSEWRQSR